MTGLRGLQLPLHGQAADRDVTAADNATIGLPVVPVDPTTTRGSRVRWVVGRVDTALSAIVVAAFVLMALAPGLVTSNDPELAVPADRLTAPGAAHWFGTDPIGRDLFARVVHGAGISLRAALIAVVISLVVGSLIGLLAGSGGRRADSLLMRLCDALLAIPGLLLALAILSAFGYGSTRAGVAIGIGMVPSFARLMRSEVLRVRSSVYVEAATSCGVRPATVLRRHVLPNSWNPVLVLATLEFGQALLLIGALSYLGFGEPPPSPEWGALIANGQNYLATAWWLAVLPGLVLAVVVIAVNRLAHVRRGAGR